MTDDVRSIVLQADEPVAYKSVQFLTASELDEPEADEPDGNTGPRRTAAASVEGDLDGEPFAFDDWSPDVPLLDFLRSKGIDSVKVTYSG